MILSTVKKKSQYFDFSSCNSVAKIDNLFPMRMKLQGLEPSHAQPLRRLSSSAQAGGTFFKMEQFEIYGELQKN